MLRPAARYSKTKDGISIAWTELGAGPLTLVLVPGLISQVELAWEEPAYEQFLSRLAAFARVLTFDRRGSGLSDPVEGDGEHLSLEHLAMDVEAVVDAAETAEAALLGVSIGSMTAVEFAWRHPDRAAALILIGSTAKFTRDDDFPLGVEPQEVDEWVRAFARSWGSGAAVEALSPNLHANERYRAWAARLERHTASPTTIERTLRQVATYDIRRELSDLSLPTLVIHRVGDRITSVEHSQFIASRIDGATLVELPGDDHTFFLGEQESMVNAILRFLDERVAGGELTAAARRTERAGAYSYGWNSLTPSEREVAILVAAGLSNREISRRLNRSPHTIDGHLRRIFAKLDVSTRVGVAAEYSRIAN